MFLKLRLESLNAPPMVKRSLGGNFGKVLLEVSNSPSTNNFISFWFVLKPFFFGRWTFLFLDLLLTAYYLNLVKIVD